MKWLQIGLSKSGNFWLYNILQNIQKQAGLEQKSFIQAQPIYSIAKTWDLSFQGQAGIDMLDINQTKCLYRISSALQVPIDDIENYIQQTTHVWSHSLFGPLSARVYSQFDKLIYILRDPRDVLISLSKFAFTPYRLKYYAHAEKSPESFLENKLAEITDQWVQHVGGHLKVQNQFKIYFLIYERLLVNFDEELAKLLDYLGLSLNSSALSEIKHSTHFDTLKGSNPQHLRKGTSSQWAKTLNSSQLKRIARIAGPLMRSLNYPLRSNQTHLPKLPLGLQANRLDKIMRHARRQTQLQKAKRHLFQVFKR